MPACGSGEGRKKRYFRGMEGCSQHPRKEALRLFSSPCFLGTRSLGLSDVAHIAVMMSLGCRGSSSLPGEL